MAVNIDPLLPPKRGKTARFQVDQVGDKDESNGFEENAWTNKGDTLHWTQYPNKSLRHYLTREVLPTENNYRNLFSFGRHSFRGRQRPTMEQLREEDNEQRSKFVGDDAEKQNPKEASKGTKLGWINGVYVSKFKPKFTSEIIMILCRCRAC